MGIRIQNNDKSTATEIVSGGTAETVLDANLTVMKDAVNGLVDVAGNKVGGAGSGLDADLLKGLPADFTSNLSSSGYQKLPSGLIMQWGNNNGVGISDLDTITFPITFPNACLNVVTGEGTVSTSGPDGIVSVGVAQDTLTTTSFKIRTTGATICFWLAIGY